MHTECDIGNRLNRKKTRKGKNNELINKEEKLTCVETELERTAIPRTLKIIFLRTLFSSIILCTLQT